MRRRGPGGATGAGRPAAAAAAAATAAGGVGPARGQIRQGSVRLSALRLDGRLSRQRKRRGEDGQLSGQARRRAPCERQGLTDERASRLQIRFRNLLKLKASKAARAGRRVRQMIWMGSSCWMGVSRVKGSGGTKHSQTRLPAPPTRPPDPPARLTVNTPERGQRSHRPSTTDTLRSRLKFALTTQRSPRRLFLPSARRSG